MRSQPGRKNRSTRAPITRTVADAALAHLAALPSEIAVGALEMQATLGEGGMGVVRLATQVALGRKVAVKTVKSDQRTEAATFKLLREAWVTGHLEHPNVVPVYDIGLDQESGPVIVLKRIEGVRWLDLSGLRCDLKYEFNASNRDLYGRASGLVVAEVQPEHAALPAPPPDAADAPPTEP